LVGAQHCHTEARCHAVDRSYDCRCGLLLLLAAAKSRCRILMQTIKADNKRSPRGRTNIHSRCQWPYKSFLLCRLGVNLTGLTSPGSAGSLLAAQPS
jgi:hypothetical protein